MAIVSTGLLEKGIRSEFMAKFSNTVTHFADLSTRIQSNSDSEKYKWLGSVPKMREWGTGRKSQGLLTESYSVENLTYESTLEVDRNEIADDQTGQIRVRANELGERAATHKDFLLSQLLINGGAAGFLSYDGVPFFSSTHVSGKSGNQDNDLAATAVDASNPTTDEFKTAFKNAMAAMLGFKDDQGDPMAFGAGGMTIVTAPSMLFAAMEAVNATIINNTTNVLQGAATVIGMPWLTDAKVFYLLKTDAHLRPFIFQDREPIEFDSLVEGSEENFKKGIWLFGVRARYAMAYGHWAFSTRTTFA